MMSHFQLIKTYLFLLGIILLVMLLIPFTPPSSFPRGTIVMVDAGSSLQSLALKLEREGVIRSPLAFRMAATILGGERDMKAGSYYLPRPQGPVQLAWRILHAKYDIDTIKITVPEGFTVKEISKLMSDDKFPFFDNELFERTAPEGYLFPDTYFMPVTATATSTIRTMRDNFISKVFDLMPEIEESGRSLEDIVVMASIIEAETNNQPDREIVSGILWKRLSIGMPLQVDAEMGTYEYTGLPPKPIVNPGILSIKAAIHPKASSYLYYLHGRDGKTYYSKTFDEHVENKRKYLN